MTEPTFIIVWRFPGNQVNKVESRFLPEVSKIKDARAYLDKPSDKGLPVTARVVFASKAARDGFMNCQHHVASIVALARKYRVLDEGIDPRATSTQFYEPVDGYHIWNHPNDEYLAFTEALTIWANAQGREILKLYSYEYVFPYNQEGPVHNEFVPLVASIGINGLTSVIEEDVRESQRTQRVQLTFATRAHRTDFLNNKEVVDELLGIARTLGLNKSRKIDVRITVPVVPS